MVDAVDTMAYKGEKPWHGLGFAVKNNLTPEQMVKAAKVDWTVSKRRLFVEGGKIELKNYRALVRDDNSYVLDIVGEGWHETQNAEAADFFKKFTAAGHMTMETMGSLHYGRYVWALARVGKDFTLGKDDKVQSYLLLCNPHAHGRSRVIKFTSVRVVCWNTLSMALGGTGNAYSIPHTRKFDDTARKAAEEALGLAKEQMTDFQEVAQLLTKKKATAEKVEEYFCEVMEFDPKKADKKKDGEIKVPRMLTHVRTALLQAPGQQMPTALGTWWGALNAVTYVVDHDSGHERDTALRSAWLGSKARLKQRALDLAVKHAK